MQSEFRGLARILCGVIYALLIAAALGMIVAFAAGGYGWLAHSGAALKVAEVGLSLSVCSLIIVFVSIITGPKLR